MGRLYDMSLGKIDQLHRVLASAGLSSELVEEVLANPALVRMWIDMIHEQRKAAEAPFTSVFFEPEHIYDLFAARVKECGWAFTDTYLAELKAARPRNFDSRVDNLLTLDIWLGSAAHTFQALWEWATQVHRGAHMSGPLHTEIGYDQVRVLDESRYGSEPSARWVALDLTAMRGRTPRDVRDQATSPGFEVLTAAILHRNWYELIKEFEPQSNTNLPQIWLPGLYISGSSCGGTDGYVPLLSAHHYAKSLTLKFALDYCGITDGYAVPTRRDL